jgi:hypothetical protein
LNTAREHHKNQENSGRHTRPVAEPVHKRTTGVTTPAKSPSQAEMTGLSRKFGADDGRQAAITPRAMRVTMAPVNNAG